MGLGNQLVACDIHHGARGQPQANADECFRYTEKNQADQRPQGGHQARKNRHQKHLSRAESAGAQGTGSRHSLGNVVEPDGNRDIEAELRARFQPGADRQPLRDIVQGDAQKDEIPGAQDFFRIDFMGMARIHGTVEITGHVGVRYDQIQDVHHGRTQRKADHRVEHRSESNGFRNQVKSGNRQHHTRCKPQKRGQDTSSRHAEQENEYCTERGGNSGQKTV